MVASESVWCDSPTSGELAEQLRVISTSLSEQSSPAAPASTHHNKHPLSAVDGQAQSSSQASRHAEEKEPIPKLAVLKPRSHLTRSSTTRAASAVTLVETLTALDIASGPTLAADKASLSTEDPGNQSAVLSATEKGISNEFSKSLGHVTASNEAIEVTISAPPAKAVAHATRLRFEGPDTPSSTPAFFEIPIPVFPFPAGTSRCRNRDCPIKIRHEQGPYLHEGKLRTREGSIFGSSNPPPELWFLYDTSGNENSRGPGFAAIELFVKYHFGETRGERGCGSGEAGGSAQERPEQVGKRSRSWRVWSRGE